MGIEGKTFQAWKKLFSRQGWHLEFNLPVATFAARLLSLMCLIEQSP
jgi:hypothetical protein